MKILVELRPALDGHAGIPQEARLLFRGLGQLADIEVQGLIQSGDRFLPTALPSDPDFAVDLPANAQIDRLSRVVVALQPPGPRSRAAFATNLVSQIRRLTQPAALFARSVLGWHETLSWFDPTHFHDFIWRGLFSKTLPAEDFAQVTNAKFRIASAPYGAMHVCGLITAQFGFARYPRLATRGVNAVLAMSPFPATVARGTALIVRYADAVPLMMPHTIIHKAHHQALHYQALRRNVASGAFFVCNSDATRSDLLAVFPQAEPRTVTIPCIVSHHFFAEDSLIDGAREILAKRLNPAVHAGHEAAAGICSGIDRLPINYLLMVSTLEPRKNHALLVEAWEKLRSELCRGLKLVFVGALGWDHETIVGSMRRWIERGEVLLLTGVPANELRLLYKHARATVCPSYAEGFGYAGVEAMRCGGVVAASDIPVHREIYADAAEYFNPYSAEDMAGTIARLIDLHRPERRRELRAAAESVSNRYSPETILEKWRILLKEIDNQLTGDKTFV